LPKHQKHINQLIDACLQKNEKAYLEVYNRYQHAMYNVSFRILNDSMEAEDVMQEAFISAFQKMESFKRVSQFGDDIVPFGSWLKRIVINKSINALKKANNNLFSSLEIVSDRADIREKELDLSQDVGLVLNEINKLKPNYKIALLLHVVEGYDYEEISEIMQVSYQNARTIVSRAKQKLRINSKQNHARK